MKKLLTRLLLRSAGSGWLYDGSLIVWQRRTDALTAWVRRGRRDDLTGWRASLGPIMRIALLGLLAYVLWAIVRALPWLMWLLGALWLRAAWRAARMLPAAGGEEPAGQRSPSSADDVRTATLEWVWQLIGDRQGVHLRDLLAHAQAHGMFEGLEVSDLRAHLERWGIPVQKRVRVRGLGVTVGIHRDDLPAPFGPSPEAAPVEAAQPRLHPR